MRQIQFYSDSVDVSVRADTGLNRANLGFVLLCLLHLKENSFIYCILYILHIYCSIMKRYVAVFVVKVMKKVRRQSSTKCSHSSERTSNQAEEKTPV